MVLSSNMVEWEEIFQGCTFNIIFASIKIQSFNLCQYQFEQNFSCKSLGKQNDYLQILLFHWPLLTGWDFQIKKISLFKSYHKNPVLPLSSEKTCEPFHCCQTFFDKQHKKSGKNNLKYFASSVTKIFVLNKIECNLRDWRAFFRLLQVLLWRM